MEAGEALSRRGSAAKPARRLPLLPSLSIPGVLALGRICWLLAQPTGLCGSGFCAPELRSLLG